MKAHEDDEGMGASLLQGKAERAGLLSLEEGRLRGDPINVYHLQGGCKEDRAGRFSVVPSGRTRGYCHKL